MKNKKSILFLIIISIFCLTTINVNAKECGEYLTKDECPTNNGCSWGYNGSSEMNCYTTSTSIQNTADNAEKSQKSQSSSVDFCASTAVIWQIVGWVFLVVKIVIPLLLIILGVIDVSKAVIASKDDEIMKAAKTFGFRAISAVIVFFIPTIVGLVMGLIVDFKDSGAKADYEVCKTCILNPSKCDTSNDVGKN
jgi:uncharacterized Tic20 family protein